MFAPLKAGFLQAMPVMHGGAILLGVIFAGCNFTHYQAPTAASRSAFEAAGAILPQVKPGDYAEAARALPGPYHIGVGDVLGVQVSPREGGETFSAIRADALQAGIPARVSAEGAIRLPYSAEDLKVAGMTLVEAEAAITTLYYPKYVKEPPIVFAQMREYQTQSVA
ncbi:MAG TPA: polysaccharide biosynthesis/export family protein, partial [Phycisphaerae bacterium]